MNFVISRLMSRLSEWHGEHNRVAEQALLENLARLPWILGALLPLFGFGMVLAWGHAGTSLGIQATLARLVAWIDLGMMVWLSVLLVVIQVKKLHQRVTAFGRALPMILAVNFAGFGVTLSTMSQWMLPSATMYVLSCVFVGTLLLIRPSRMALVHGSSFAAFYTALGWTSAPPVVQDLIRFHGGVAAALGMCLSVVLWRRHTVTELLRRQVQAQSQVLEVKNAELASQKLLLEKLAQHDALSGLLNRRAFEAQADLALHRARRDGTAVAAVMFDLDFFKRVNDHHGHPAGDLVIKFMADVLRSSVRDTDLVARVGGEEFVLLLPGSGDRSAFDVAEKIRLLLLQTPIWVTCDVAVHMTVSAGVAEFAAGHIGAFETLYSAADHALYDAKRRGRNRVEVSRVSMKNTGASDDIIVLTTC